MSTDSPINSEFDLKVKAQLDSWVEELDLVQAEIKVSDFTTKQKNTQNANY
jgi:hypothetical protein